MMIPAKHAGGVRTVTQAIIVDPNGSVVANATVTVTNKQTGAIQTTTSDGEGHWAVSNVQPGPVSVTVNSSGFQGFQQELAVNGSRGVRMGTTLSIAGVAASVEVTSNAADSERESKRLEEQANKNKQALLNLPSQNVLNFRSRVAGVLPVRVDVPKAGKSYRFVRPLVMDEETRVTFNTSKGSEK